MKMVRGIIILCAIFLVACTDPLNRQYTLRPQTAGIPTAPLSYLAEHYNGTATEIRENAVFAGYVSANDLSGNFYKTFIIEDATAAVEICAGLYDLYNIFPLGQRVVVYAKGMWLGSYNGVIQLGRTAYASNGWRIEEFSVKSLLDKYVAKTDNFALVEPLPRKITELKPSDCGLLLSIEHVAHREASGSVWDGVHQFYNHNGDSIAVYTSSYAKFANSTLPNDSITLTGILLRGKFGSGKEQYAIKGVDTPLIIENLGVSTPANYQGVVMTLY